MPFSMMVSILLDPTSVTALQKHLTGLSIKTTVHRKLKGS